MINYNGNLINPEDLKLSQENRAFKYGDGIFETVKIQNNKILFWEDHYFRLMASMRIVRMKIPDFFTPEFLQEQIIQVITANQLENSSVRIKLNISRKQGGLYTPQSNDIDYIISVKELTNKFYTISDDYYEVALYKDHYIAPDLLSTIKSNNRIINVVGSIYAKENDFSNCFLLNTNKMVVEALNGNLFLVKDKVIKTPPVSDGCLKGILRKQLIQIIEKLPEYELVEASISPFELQKADELFITNVIHGIQPVSKFRKKTYVNATARRLLGIVNATLRLV